MTGIKFAIKLVAYRVLCCDTLVGVSDLVTLTPEQRPSASDLSSTVVSDDLLAIGTLKNRMLMWIDIDKRMSSASLGLVSSLVH